MLSKITALALSRMLVCVVLVRGEQGTTAEYESCDDALNREQV